MPLGPLLVSLVLSPALVTGGWGPLQEADGHALAVALEDGSTVLISVGGEDDTTIYDQRRTPAGELGPRTTISTVAGVTDCRPVEAATAISNVAVAVECRTDTGLEDPPTRLVELVWTGDDGWVTHVQREGTLGSVDYSPRGQFALFASTSQYGRPHHVTSYHADLGWRDLERPQRGFVGDDLVAAIGDGGDVVALRGAGTEDEPGYWFGGRLRLETYSAVTGRWTVRFDRRFPDGGVRPYAVDLAGGRIAAAVVQSRSTGRLDARDSRVVLLSGAPGTPRLWRAPRWTRQVLTAAAAITRDGVGVAAWQDVPRTIARPALATWPTTRHRPAVRDLPGRTMLTDAAATGQALDLSVASDGHAAVGYVRHLPGADHATVVASTFSVGAHGGLVHPVATTWDEPVDTTVAVSATPGSTSLTLARLEGPFVWSPVTRNAVAPG